MYPALAVLQTETNKSTRVLWVGSDDGLEADLVKRAGIAYRGIPAAGLHGVNILSIPKRLFKLTKGYFAARKIIREYKPDVLFFTGGYVGFPVALAGRNIPSVLFVPDIEPGVALNMLSKRANLITVVCEDSKKYFEKAARIEVTGYPTRKDIQNWDKAEALKYFGFSSQEPVLFIFGGSKGARSINHALKDNISQILSRCQVIHITGATDWDEMNAFYNGLPEADRERYKMFPYLHEEMGAAFSAADLVISRAGASTLGEFPLFGVPAILVPYPYAWRYQKVNADYLVSKNAAVMVRDEDLPSQIVSVVSDLLETPEKLESMKASMRQLAQPDAAEKIMNLLRESAGNKD